MPRKQLVDRLRRIGAMSGHFAVIFPRLLNYLVAIYLILSGLIGLGVIAIR